MVKCAWATAAMVHRVNTSVPYWGSTSATVTNSDDVAAMRAAVVSGSSQRRAQMDSFATTDFVRGPPATMNASRLAKKSVSVTSAGAVNLMWVYAEFGGRQRPARARAFVATGWAVSSTVKTLVTFSARPAAATSKC